VNSQAGTPTPLKRQGTFSVWFALDHSGLLGIAKAGDGKLLIKLVKSTKVADKVYDKVGNFGGGYTPQGPGPATLLQSLQTLTLLGVMGATNPLQSATSRYNLQPRAAEG